MTPVCMFVYRCTYLVSTEKRQSTDEARTPTQERLDEGHQLYSLAAVDKQSLIRGVREQP